MTQMDKETYLLAVSDLVGGSQDLSVSHERITKIAKLEADRSLAARELLLAEEKLEGKDLSETRITEKGLKAVEAIFSPLREGLSVDSFVDNFVDDLVDNLFDTEELSAESYVDGDMCPHLREFYLLKAMSQLLSKKVDDFLKRLEARSNPPKGRNTCMC